VTETITDCALWLTDAGESFKFELMKMTILMRHWNWGADQMNALLEGGVT
jgi:hypothetical protein